MLKAYIEDRTLFTNKLARISDCYKFKDLDFSRVLKSAVGEIYINIFYEMVI